MTVYAVFPQTQKYSVFLNVCCAMMVYVFCIVLCVSFCTGHFVMVPLNLIYLHCLQYSLFEHLFNLYFHKRKEDMECNEKGKTTL